MSQLRKATCHCGAVVLEIEFEHGLRNIRRCDCSMCSRKGYVMASVPRANLAVVEGKDMLSVYRWGTKVAEHFFCSQCGVHTHHKRRSNPAEFGINIACVEGVNAFAFEPVPFASADLHRPLPAVEPGS
ncbi:GFA family protein [Salinisphaera aquimarina]|uniref:GFA family protein n=1 Tax=Salinisphaera aquimarina TaxID=2094031 RepID=A0ABV7ETH0_9GAMM